MDDHASAFAIVYQPSTQGQSRLLGSTGDANEATLIVERELWRLRKQGRSSEVRVVRANAGQTIVLRLPLNALPSRLRHTTD